MLPLEICLRQCFSLPSVYAAARIGLPGRADHGRLGRRGWRSDQRGRCDVHGVRQVGRAAAPEPVRGTESDPSAAESQVGLLQWRRCVVQESGSLPRRMSSKSFPVCVLDHTGYNTWESVWGGWNGCGDAFCPFPLPLLHCFAPCCWGQLCL